jgi:hypothetical protein
MRQLTAPDAIHVSERFRLTLESSILDLEAAAARDERLLPQLDNADHQRRQKLLVAAQLDRAFRLRELLSRTALWPRRTA